MKLDIIKYFGNKLSDDNKISSNTHINYISDIKVFSHYIEKNYNDTLSVDHINKKVLKAYIMYLKNNLHYSLSSTNRVITSLRKLNSYLYEDGYIGNLPTQGLEKVYDQIKPSFILPEDLLSFFMDYVRENGEAKHIAIISLLVNTPIRLADLINLKKDDVYIKDGYVLISANDRVFPAGEKTGQDLIKYINSANKNREYFIESKRGQYSNSGIYRVIKKYGVLTDIKVNARILRNSFFFYYDKYNYFISPNVLKYITNKEIHSYFKEPRYQIIYEVLTKCEF